jgi:hypothetical protein
VRAKQALQVVSGLDWSWIRLCERKDIALRLRRSSIAGHYCAYADLQTNPMLATPRGTPEFTQLLSAAK